MIGSIYYEAQFSNMLRDMRAHFNDRKVELLREAGRETTREIGMQVAKAVKEIIADENTVSGRLAAGFGYYDPSYLRGPSDSSPSDAYFAEESRGGVFFAEMGTFVEYAGAVFQGFTVEETRVVYLPAEDRFITVKPFTFAGIHAVERAMAQVATTGNYNRTFRKALRHFEREWNRAGRATTK